jgi:type IV secretory pathway VirB10-like protein
MADQEPQTLGAPSVTDRRPVPRGVLPRGVQTWLMAALALGIVLIVLFAGHPEPPAASAPVAGIPQQPNADRVRQYQDRLRALETRAAQETQVPPIQQPQSLTLYQEPQAPRPEDPIVAERRRREYESLFASNVVLSRRPETERPDTGLTPIGETTHGMRSRDASIDEIADAVVRATTRVGTLAAAPALTPPSSERRPTTTTTEEPPDRRAFNKHSDRISPVSPLHRILEGTMMDVVLTNRLDGGAEAPVNCLFTNPDYSHSGQLVLIPAGARVLGETRPVQALGETRLAVAFHRLLMPDGRTYSLDQFLGMNQIGDAGLRDRVNQHYLSTFGAAGAVGLISGLGQWLGTAGLTRGDGDRTVIIAGGTADATSQASLQVMNRFLNRLPTITVREGHRVKVYLTSDIELPAYGL